MLVSFISETVLVGFKCGVALHIASSQLPKLFGFKGGHGDFWERSHDFLGHLNETNGVALLVGGIALAVLLLGKRFFPRVPVGFLVVVFGIALSPVANLAQYGVKLLGVVPQGLPPIGLPAVSWPEVNDLVPLAMACFLLGAVETAAIGRTFARKHGYRFDANQEFLALGASNLGAGLGSGLPISAGMSQSLVNESSGARTAASGLVAAAILLLVTLFLSGLMRDLPQPVLAAIILVAVTGLVKIDALKRIWRFSRAEFGVSMVALLGVLGQGLLRGVLIGAILSIVHAAPARVASPRDRARTRPGQHVLRGPRAEPGERAPSPTSSSSGSRGRSSTSTPSTSRTGSSSMLNARARGGAPRRVLPRKRARDRSRRRRDADRPASGPSEARSRSPPRGGTWTRPGCAAQSRIS